jgi:hypothetical protein
LIIVHCSLVIGHCSLGDFSQGGASDPNMTFIGCMPIAAHRLPMPTSELHSRFHLNRRTSNGAKFMARRSWLRSAKESLTCQIAKLPSCQS